MLLGKILGTDNVFKPLNYLRSYIGILGLHDIQGHA